MLSKAEWPSQGRTARGLSEAGSNEDLHCSLFRYAKGTPFSRTFKVGCGHLFLFEASGIAGQCQLSWKCP